MRKAPASESGPYEGEPKGDGVKPPLQSKSADKHEGHGDAVPPGVLAGRMLVKNVG